MAAASLGTNPARRVCATELAALFLTMLWQAMASPMARLMPGKLIGGNIGLRVVLELPEQVCPVDQDEPGGHLVGPDWPAEVIR